MAKNTFLSFSTTAGDNTDVGGIGILGSASVSNFDNALRTLMAILRGDLDNGAVFVTRSTGYTAVAGDNNAFYEFTATATLALTAAATLAADWHMMVFANGGVVTIDPDASELINGAATYKIPNGSAAYIICTGTAFKAVIIPSLVQPSIDVASATTTDIGAVASENVRITGTTTITGLGTAPAGMVRNVLFAAALTLTHNGTSLILPGAASIVTAAGDTATFLSEGSGNWRCTKYQYAAFRSSGGVVERGSNANGSYVRFADGTQICTTIRSLNIGNIVAAGNIYRDILAWGSGWTFPAAFSAIPSISFSLESSVYWLSGAGATTTGTGVITVFGYTNPIITANAGGIAIGRWF